MKSLEFKDVTIANFCDRKTLDPPDRSPENRGCARFVVPAPIPLFTPLLPLKNFCPPSLRLSRFGSIAAALAFATPFVRAQTAPPATTTTISAASNKFEETLVLSPFTVIAEDKGYQAFNTLAGTRINSKLEDLGASITVVTKQQLEDTAVLDINDLFRYEASTEGTDDFTQFTP